MTRGQASEAQIEQEIQAKGLTAPRITPEQVDAQIQRVQFHVFEGSQLTVCCITLRNGFTVVGESACASPENFNAAIGEKIARDKAREKIWPLLGYALREQLNRPAAADQGALSYQQRVLAEKHDLAEKLGKLKTFLASPQIESLDPEQRSLLSRQAVHMEGYLKVLVDRITTFA